MYSYRVAHEGFKRVKVTETQPRVLNPVEDALADDLWRGMTKGVSKKTLDNWPKFGVAAYVRSNGTLNVTLQRTNRRNIALDSELTGQNMTAIAAAAVVTPDYDWLLARRASWVDGAPGMWESVTSGSLDTAPISDRLIEDHLVTELQQEVGSSGFSELKPLAVIRSTVHKLGRLGADSMSFYPLVYVGTIPERFNELRLPFEEHDAYMPVPVRDAVRVVSGMYKHNMLLPSTMAIAGLLQKALK